MDDFILESVLNSSGYRPGIQPLKWLAKLNTNELPFPPSPKVKAAITANLFDLNRYPEPDANTLCRAAAEVYGVDPECILACNGGDEGLSVVMRAMLAVGDHITTLNQTYPFYATFAALLGVKVDAVSFGDISPALAGKDTKLTILARPNSPCGKILNRSTIAEWRGPLLVDEAYVEFSGDSVVDLLTIKPDLMILRTLSKAYGLAGLRIGFILARPEIINHLRKVRGVYTVDRLASVAGTAALQDRNYLASTLESIRSERRLLFSELRRLGFSLEETSTNFLWVPKVSSSIFEKLTEKGIYIRALLTGQDLGARVTVGTKHQNIALISCLENILNY